MGETFAVMLPGDLSDEEEQNAAVTSHLGRRESAQLGWQCRLLKTGRSQTSPAGEARK